MERESGEAGKERNELRGCKNRFSRKRRRIFLQRGNGQGQMRREKREGRNRGSTKVRFERGKKFLIVGTERPKAARDSRKVSKVGRETRGKGREK
jgi:hypothetical protein